MKLRAGETNLAKKVKYAGKKVTKLFVLALMNSQIIAGWLQSLQKLCASKNNYEGWGCFKSETGKKTILHIENFKLI